MRGRVGGRRLANESRGEESCDDAIQRAGARNERAARLGDNSVLDGVAVEGSTREGEEDVILEGAHAVFAPEP